jgi:hypothetical protein
VRGFALAAAFVAAAFLPGQRLGVAVPAVAALMLLAASAAFRVSALRVVLGVLSLALAAQASLLDATWVLALDLAAAWVLASIAASGVALEALTAPALRLRHVPAIVPRPSEQQEPALRGVATGAAVVVPFLLLFLSADAAFAGFAGDLPLPSSASLPGRLALLALVLAAALGLGLAARHPLTEWEPFPGRRLSLAEWWIPLALLDALFVAFVAVQFAVLFGGNDQVLETAGLTYAEYARSGFWQLLAATALTFVVVGVVLAYADVRNTRDSLILRLLLGLLCTLALVVLVSALHRLRLYEDAFGLTRLRLLAETIALWLGAMLVLATGAVAPRAVLARVGTLAVVATAVGLLAFSLSSPDRRVADRNVARWRQTGMIDIDYLRTLSADAVPALVRLPLPERRRATVDLREQLRSGDPWGSANLSRTRARRLLGLSGS